jgi:hypothetical protein
MEQEIQDGEHEIVASIIFFYLMDHVQSTVMPLLQPVLHMGHAIWDYLEVRLYIEHLTCKSLNKAEMLDYVARKAQTFHVVMGSSCKREL